MTLSLLIVSLFLVHPASAASPTWVSLNLTAPPAILDHELAVNFVDVLVGTPPQTVQLSIDLQSDAIDVYSSECPFCPGWTFFDESLSSTYRVNNDRPLNGSNTFTGTWAFDTVGFGGVVQSENVDLGVLTTISTNYTGLHIRNGGIGLITDTFRKATDFNRLIPGLFSSGKLINPVIGLNLFPNNPKLTIGWLDPSDYVGEINWVPLEKNQEDWFKYNLFKIDGFSGRNGSLIPFGDNLLASVDNFVKSITVPNNLTYFNDTNYTGPIWDLYDGFNIDPDEHQVSYPCNKSRNAPNVTELPPHPYADFKVHINGVSYMIDSDNNLVRPESGFSPSGFCNVGIISTFEQITTAPQSILGQPFLRSVYLAYRHPADSCPGYFGFAFPRGANRTQAEISQKPTSTPTQSSQCLVLTSPTSTPAIQRPPGPDAPKGSYPAFGEDNVWVPLRGAELLTKGVWNITG